MKSMRLRILSLMGRDDYHPMNKSEMARALEIPSNVHRENKRGSEGGLMVGVIKFQQSSGHAWFYPDLDNKDNILAGLNPEKFDRVFVQSYNTGLALDGDRVSVRVKFRKGEWYCLRYLS